MIIEIKVESLLELDRENSNRKIITTTSEFLPLPFQSIDLSTMHSQTLNNLDLFILNNTQEDLSCNTPKYKIVRILLLPTKSNSWNRFFSLELHDWFFIFNTMQFDSFITTASYQHLPTKMKTETSNCSWMCLVTIQQFEVFGRINC